MTLLEKPNTTRELVEVELLRCTERILLEEWDNHFEQVGTSSDNVPIQVFFMIVIAGISHHLTNLKEVTQFLETRDAFGTLRHHEFMRHLVTSFADCLSTTARLPNDADGEATFPVNKSRDPA